MNSQTEVTLKPCPFCGGEAERITITEDDGHGNIGGDVITCTRCGASSHVEFGRKENLVSRWNTRPTSTPEAGEVERLIAGLRDAADFARAAKGNHRRSVHPEVAARKFDAAADALAALRPTSTPEARNRTQLLGEIADAYEKDETEGAFDRALEAAFHAGRKSALRSDGADELLRRVRPYVDAAHVGIDTAAERCALRRDIDARLEARK